MNHDTWLTNQNDIDELYGDERYRQEREERERQEELNKYRMRSSKYESKT
jgi:hypothetical protein